MPGDNAEVQCELLVPMAVHEANPNPNPNPNPSPNPNPNPSPSPNPNPNANPNPNQVHEGQRFAFREGGRTVGAGVVSKLG